MKYVKIFVDFRKSLDMLSDAEKGRLSTYAARCIENELLMYFRSRKKTSKEVSYYEPIGTDKEGNEISFIDVVEDPSDDVLDQMMLDERIRKMYIAIGEVLTMREKEIISKRYGLFGNTEITQKELGKILGISRSYVSRIEKRALQKLRKYIEENE